MEKAKPFRLGDGSRMTRECHVRFCEQRRGKFPPLTLLLVLARYVDRRITGWVESKIERWLGLEINRDKTRVVNLRQVGQSLDFLGYTFRYDRDLWGRNGRYLNMFPSKTAVARERKRLRSMTGTQMCFKPIPMLIGELNVHLRGWANYFGRGYPRDAFRQINWYVRERLYRHLRRRSQRPWRPPEGMTWYACLKRMGLIYLGDDFVHISRVP